MASYLKPNSFLLLVPFIAFQITACNNNGNSEKPSDKKDSTGAVKETPLINQTALPLINGSVDTLYADATSFKNLPKKKKVFFVLTFLSPDTLTLHGWTTKKGEYDSLPKIMLIKGPPKTINQSPLYFGSVKLDSGDIKRIKEVIDSAHAKYVLFDPVLFYTNHVRYAITVSDDKPGFNKLLVTSPTGTFANPSPPKTN
jgi:hypothetical protein